MDNQQGLASLGGVPVRYVGKKAVKRDNVANTDLEWTPGQIHIVPPLVAQKLTRYPDIWREADPAAIEDDPSNLGMTIVDQDTLANGSMAGEAEETETDEQKTFDLPNLQGMTKVDLQTYAASQFNQQLDAGLKKEEMINQIVTLANGSMAGEAE